MKKLITFCLLILVLFAFNYKTISYFFIQSNSSIVFLDDVNCEEKDSESKKSDQKNDKKDLSEYILFNRSNVRILSSHLGLIPQSILPYTSNDYSIAVYSPPDELVL